MNHSTRRTDRRRVRRSTSKAIRPICLLLLGMLGSTAWAAEPPAPPMLAELWTCNYNSGKDMEDVLKARDYMLGQAEKAGIALPDSYIWSLVKGNLPMETIWFNIHDDFLAYTAASDAWVASGVSEAVLERFYAASSCATGLATFRPVFGREGLAEDDTPTFLTSSGCRFRKGAGPAQLPDLAGHMSEAMGAMGENAPYFAGLFEPFTTRPNGQPEVVLFNVFANAGGWGNYVNEIYSTDAGETLRNHMGMVLDCDVAVWTSVQVVQGTNGE